MARSGQEVVCEGWLTKSPPTKRIWRAVSTDFSAFKNAFSSYFISCKLVHKRVIHPITNDILVEVATTMVLIKTFRRDSRPIHTNLLRGQKLQKTERLHKFRRLRTGRLGIETRRTQTEIRPCL
jgi:hypothetical protein